MLGQHSSRKVFTNARAFRLPLRPIRAFEPSVHTARFPLPSRILVRHYNPVTPQRKGWDKFRHAYREQPILFSIAMGGIIVGLGFWGFINYYYIYSIVIPYHNIPEPVAKQLRKASFYDQDTKLGDPKKAFKFYAESLAVAHEIGMNPFSKEVLGIRLRIAAFMEKHWQHEAAIELLENIRKQCFAFVDKVGDNHIGDGHRTRVLGLTVKIGVKLGELYNNPNVDNPDAAQAALISAVETYLKEKQRREKDDVQEKEGDWFNDEEAGAALEALGVSYLSGQKSEYALPLFLQALTFCPPSSCHSAVLMNNIAMALSEQKPSSALVPSSSSKAAIPTPSDLREQARLWAQRALTVAQSVSPPERTEECDFVCVIATQNLGELAEMAGNLESARELFTQALSLSKAAAFQDGIKQAMEALKRVQAP